MMRCSVLHTTIQKRRRLGRPPDRLSPLILRSPVGGVKARTGAPSSFGGYLRCFIEDLRRFW